GIISANAPSLEQDGIKLNRCEPRIPFTSPKGRGRIASTDAIRVRGSALTESCGPLTRFALDDASHRQEQIDLSPLGRGETPKQSNLISSCPRMTSTRQKERPARSGPCNDQSQTQRSGILAVDVGEIVLRGLRSVGDQLPKIFGGRLRP